jgi:hypothetical protein
MNLQGTSFVRAVSVLLRTPSPNVRFTIENAVCRTLKKVMDRMRTTERELAGLRKQRAGLKANAEAIDQAIEELVRGHRHPLLPYGAVGWLALDQAVDVLPLDDATTLDPAQPLRADPAKLAARHEAQVGAALASGPVAVIVLGASHDLSADVAKLGGGTTEYVQVTTKTVARFAGKDSP